MFYDKKELTALILKNLIKVGLSIILATILISLLSRGIVKISETITTKKMAALLLEKKDQMIGLMKEDLQKVEGGEQKIINAFPLPEDILELVGQFESLAARNSLIQTLRFGTPSPFSSIDTELKISYLDFEVSLNSNVFNLLDYLKGLENLPYFVSVSSININAPPGRGWEDSSNISLRGNVYLKGE